MTSEVWLTTTEAGSALGYSSDWVLAQIKAGKLPATINKGEVRRSYRIRREDLAAFERGYLSADGASQR